MTLEAPPKNIEKINKYRVSNIELVLTHTVSEWSVLGIAGKLLVPFVILCKKKFNIFKEFTAQGLPKTQSTIVWLIGTLGVKLVL